MSRPWEVNKANWERVQRLFPEWLQERDGIVVYENQNFDSSAFGDRSFVPALVTDHDTDTLTPAPEWVNSLPSLRQMKVGHIKLEEFEGDVGIAMDFYFKIGE